MDFSEMMPGDIADRVTRAAREAGKKEIVGFVLTRWRLVFMPNVADDPERQFRIEDDALLDFYEQFMGEIIGMFHSHPEGRTSPSNVDVDHAPVGMRYWIATHDGVYEWDLRDDPPSPLPGPEAILAAPDVAPGAPDGRGGTATAR